jgi:EAL domain-containing protein (putative c-di-GMP-specific phosphodiesterase class I)
MRIGDSSWNSSSASGYWSTLKGLGKSIQRILVPLRAQLVVKAIVGIAGGMGKKTIAEFVADGETVRLLEKCGVDFAQGYHIGHSRPMRDVLSN